MTVEAWLDEREPQPPEALSERMIPLLTGPGGDLSERFCAVACDAADRVYANPGRVRESALDLLVADALLTYACEAALEREDPEPALLDVLSRVVGPR